MALDSFLLELLEDPVDHGSLLYIEGDQVLYNPRRHVAYQVLDSIPVLLPDEASPVSDERHDAYVTDRSARSTGKVS